MAILRPSKQAPAHHPEKKAARTGGLAGKGAPPRTRIHSTFAVPLARTLVETAAMAA